jgi:hypothetical protein
MVLSRPQSRFAILHIRCATNRFDTSLPQFIPAFERPPYTLNVSPEVLGGYLSNPLKSALFAPLSILLLAIPSYGTEIVMVVSRQLVVLASDSRTINTDKPNGTMCKIRQTNGIFWAAAGLNNDDATRFNVDNFFEKTLALTGRNTGAILDAIGDVITPALQKELPIVKMKDPSFYKDASGANGTILMLFAAQKTKNGIEGFVKVFSLSDDRVIQQASRTCDFSTSVQCVVFTNNKGVREYVASHPEILSASPEETIERLMSVGETNEPDWVSPPITILSVSPSGATWKSQNNCKDIKN